jgi:hypothetical protein
MPVGAPAAPAEKRTRTTTVRTAKPATAGTQARQDTREEGLIGLAQIGQALLIMSKNYADAGAVDMHARPIAHEIAVLASEDEKIATIVDRITALGPYAALIGAVMPLALQLMVNHDRIKADAAGMLGGKVMSKEALAAKVEADIAKAKAAFLREAREAQEEAAQAQADLERVAA